MICLLRAKARLPAGDIGVLLRQLFLILRTDRLQERSSKRLRQLDFRLAVGAGNDWFVHGGGHGFPRFDSPRISVTPANVNGPQGLRRHELMLWPARVASLQEWSLMRPAGLDVLNGALVPNPGKTAPLLSAPRQYTDVRFRSQTCV